MSFLKDFVASFMSVVHADDEEEELVDPQKVLREKCKLTKACVALEEKLNTCNDRVNSRSNTEESCFEELIDYVECVDHCAAKTLFNHLK